VEPLTLHGASLPGLVPALLLLNEKIRVLAST
jgi:hypothetical protein